MILLFSAILILMTSCKTQTIINEETEEAEASSVIDDVIPSVTQALPETTTEATTAVQTTEMTTEAQAVETNATETEVDLSITLPEANGKMRVDKDSSNKFTVKIAEEKNISTELLVAVYTVPETDQNYVFEFYSDDFSADNIRRVFLLDSDCKITGIAADKSDERKDMSVTENWFCMNVLIRGVIFPEIEEQFR